jgi:hypothetical protein
MLDGHRHVDLVRMSATQGWLTAVGDFALLGWLQARQLAGLRFVPWNVSNWRQILDDLSGVDLAIDVGLAPMPPQPRSN